MTKNLVVLAVVTAFAAGLWIGRAQRPGVVAHAAGVRAGSLAADHVFELRTYTAPPGKLDALKSRFRDHTIRLFNKHSMRAIGYWTPEDAPLSENTLIYILQHPSRDAAKANWAAFSADPEWVKVKAESEKDGPLTTKRPDSVFLLPTDFSPVK